MIPKRIHYCWFGNNPKPKLIQKCIASWKQMLPDWEISEWNETNYDVTKNEYIAEAYRQKKWAFVVDYARFDILNQYGGVFFDTDVELLKPIPESFLAYQAFTGFESDRTVNPGLVYASEADQTVLRSIMNTYEHKQFGEKINGRIENIVDIVTDVLDQKGLKKDNSFQVIEGIAVFPKEYFCCFNHEIQAFEIGEETVSVHHYVASWSPWYRRAYFRTIKYVARILGKENYLCMKRRIKKILK